MNWTLFIPEMTMLLATAVCLALACAAPDPRRDHGAALILAVAGVAAAAACIAVTGELFRHAYRVDLFSQAFKVCLALGFFLIVCLCDRLDGVAAERHGEFYALLALSTLAMMLLVSSTHLMAVYLSLELSSYSLYVLVFMRRQHRWGMDAGLRYFLVGICASAVMLFGLALIYGAAGTLHLDALGNLTPRDLTRPAMAAGVLLTLGGFFFKLAVFPFHIWAPDAYQGAPNQVAAFIATASKVAAVAVLIRVTAPVHAMGGLLAKGLIALSILSMTAGNLSAIAQKDFKRLMAFSSVAHAGYLMIGILCLTPAGYAGAGFYAVAVLVMKFTCFMVMIKVAADGRNLRIDELAGLHRRAPLLAMALMLALFGLAGIPPTIGFTAKLLIFKAAMEQGYLFLVVIAMINVVISLYYYLLVLKAAYLDEPAAPVPDIALSLPNRVLALAMITLIVAVGFYPTALMDLVYAATHGL
jgi:NADH-quinone oxidoreductase subunit N